MSQDYPQKPKLFINFQDVHGEKFTKHYEFPERPNNEQLFSVLARVLRDIAPGVEEEQRPMDSWFVLCLLEPLVNMIPFSLEPDNMETPPEDAMRKLLHRVVMLYDGWEGSPCFSEYANLKEKKVDGGKKLRVSFDIPLEE